MSRTLIVFAKEPVAGRVKTRLKSCFADAKLARLYKAFVEDTLVIAKETRCQRKILAFASARAPCFLRSVGNSFELIEQRGRTLGERMHNAFVYAKENESKKTVIIGTDSPTLSSSLIEKAFKKLERHDVVLGPSFDGGYYLIGMKELCPDLFKGIRWSSCDVTRRTLQNAKRIGRRVALLDEWYDVDGREGLERLKKHLKTVRRKGFAENTRRFLKE